MGGVSGFGAKPSDMACQTARPLCLSHRRMCGSGTEDAARSSASDVVCVTATGSSIAGWVFFDFSLSTPLSASTSGCHTETLFLRPASAARLNVQQTGCLCMATPWRRDKPRFANRSSEAGKSSPEFQPMGPLRARLKLAENEPKLFRVLAWFAEMGIELLAGTADAQACHELQGVQNKQSWQLERPLARPPWSNGSGKDQTRQLWRDACKLQQRLGFFNAGDCKHPIDHPVSRCNSSAQYGETTRSVL